MNLSLPIPSFINRDADAIVSDMIAYFENEVGKSLEPAQVERILIDMWAYRETLLRNDVQSAAMQNLLRFARFPVLDYLGELVGVERLPASPAGTTLSMSLNTSLTGITLPAGLRVRSADGRVIFQTVESVTIPAGPATTITVDAIAQQSGAIGNDYVAGAINIILDPQPYLLTATNTTLSAGGADEESDDQLRERINLAPSAFSNAGSKGAYKYFARSAHPSIIDVGILSSTPGTVEVYPLSKLGLPTPTAVLNAVTATLTDEKVRPLTDTVVVASPTAVTTTIAVELTLLPDAPQSIIEAQVLALLQAYKAEKQSKLGLDVVPSQIGAKSQLDGVYKAVVTSPATDITVAENEIANITSVTVITTGTHAA